MKTPILLITGAALALGSAQVQADDISAGRDMYSQSCAQCHGASGKGMASFPSLQDRDADYITKRLEQYRGGERVGSNTGLMASFAADLSDEEIANLAAYISTEFQ